jgi:hypothetical protein
MKENTNSKNLPEENAEINLSTGASSAQTIKE